MFSTVQHPGIRVLLPAAALGFMLSAGEAWAQARLQATRQNGQCQHNGGQAQLNSQQQLNALRTALRSSLRQLNTSQQTGQLASAQLQAVNDLKTAARANGIYEDAGERARLQLTNLFHQLGLQVEFVKDK